MQHTRGGLRSTVQNVYLPYPGGEIAGHPGRALAALASLHRNFTGAQGTGYFPDIFENGDFFLRFQKNTHQHVAYPNRFCASLEKVVSLEAAFLDVTLRDIQKTAARETM